MQERYLLKFVPDLCDANAPLVPICFFCYFNEAPNIRLAPLEIPSQVISEVHLPSIRSWLKDFDRLAKHGNEEGKINAPEFMIREHKNFNEEANAECQRQGTHVFIGYLKALRRYLGPNFVLQPADPQVLLHDNANTEHQPHHGPMVGRGLGPKVPVKA